MLALISGRVQGVGYRDWTRRRAAELGLSGWVRNRSDGKVEALLHGPADKIDSMIETCRKGPLLARVEQVTRAPAEPPDHADFRKLPTV